MDPYVDGEKDAFFMDIERQILLLMADDGESSLDAACRTPKESKTSPSLLTEQWDCSISRSACRRRHSNPLTPQRLKTKQPAAGGPNCRFCCRERGREQESLFPAVAPLLVPEGLKLGLLVGEKELVHAKKI